MARRFKKRRLSLCSYPGCKVACYSNRCEKHTPAKVGSERYKQSKKFLNSAAWQKAREFKLLRTPHCEECEKEGDAFVPAIDVDHILPRHTHPELALVQNNLQSLCKRHHGIKTARGQ